VIDLFFDFSKCKSFQKALTRTGEVEEVSNALKISLTQFLNATKAEKSDVEMM